MKRKTVKMMALGILCAGRRAGRGPASTSGKMPKIRIPTWRPLTNTSFRTAMPKSPWREARLRHPFPRTPQLWSSEGMAMKLRSKARTALSAS